MGADANDEIARVAVIAIHGVGQHLPGASADAVSTLLISLGRDWPVEKDSEENEGAPLRTRVL